MGDIVREYPDFVWDKLVVHPDGLRIIHDLANALEGLLIRVYLEPGEMAVDFSARRADRALSALASKLNELSLDNTLASLGEFAMEPDDLPAIRDSALINMAHDVDPLGTEQDDELPHQDSMVTP